MLAGALALSAVGPLEGCAPTPRSAAPAASPAPTDGPPAEPQATPGGCHERGSGSLVLPDPVCTPGATNPAVTQATIHITICARGWTATVRPAASVTEALKRQQMAAYGDQGRISSYEEDHLIPLELGGAPAAPSNLWPEPGASPNPKDEVERAANYAVCTGRLTLVAAQASMTSNWVTFAQQLAPAPERPAPGGRFSGSAALTGQRP